MSKYSKSMAQILREMNEATFVDNFFDANKPMSKIKADARKYGITIKVKKGGGQMGADSATLTGPESGIIKYAQNHLDASKKVRNLRDLKKELGEQEDPEDKAREKIDKIQRVAALKKQIQDIQKEQDEDLDDKDVDTIKPIIKQLKKSVKAHDKQAKQLTKDIQDEFESLEDVIEQLIKAKTPQEKIKTLVKMDKLKSKARRVMNDKDKAKKMANDLNDLAEFTSSQIARLKKEYESLRGKETGINPERFKQLRGMMKRFPKASLLKLAKEDIPLLSSGAKAALVMYHGMKYKQIPEDFVPYIDLFADDTLDEQKGKFKSVDPKVYARISKMMKGSKEEKQGLANMLNYFMPPEVVDMVRDKFGIKMPRGKIKFTDL